MGKGNRNKANKEIATQADREVQERIAKSKKRKKTAIVLTTIFAVLAIVLTAAGVTAYEYMKDNGSFLRMQTAVSGPTMKVDGAMMSYFVYSEYYTFRTNYASSYKELGIEAGTSMKDVTISEGYTLFDYLSEGALAKVKEYLIYCEAAKAAGVTLSDEEKSVILSQLENVNPSNFGVGLKTSDIENALNLKGLAEKYRYMLEKENSFSASDEQAYLTEHADELKTAQHYNFAFSYNKEANGENIYTAEQAAAYSQELASAGTAEDYLAILVREIAKVLPLGEDYVKTIAESYLVSDANTITDTDSRAWLISDETAVGATRVFHDEEKGKYFVYMKAGAAYTNLDESATANIRHIMFTSATYGSDKKAQQAAEKALEEWNTSGKTTEKFELLALKYSSDTNSAARGGLFSNMRKGQIADAFDEWAFAEGRKAGDCEVIQSDYGWHVIFYESPGLTGWKTDAYIEFVEKVQTAKHEDFSKAYPIKVNDSVIKKVEI